MIFLPGLEPRLTGMPGSFVAVDPQHYLVRGRPVRFYYPNGDRLNPVGGPSILSLPTSNARYPQFGGMKYFENDNTPKYWQASPGKILSGWNQWSVFAIAATAQVQRSGGRWIYCERGTAGNDIIQIGGLNTGAGSGSTYVLTVRDDAGALLQLSTAFSVTTNQLFSICGVRYGATNHALYVDGAFGVSSATSISNTYTDASVSSNIGFDPAQSGTGGWAGPIICVILFPGSALSQMEVAQLHQNAWQILDAGGKFLSAGIAQALQTNWFMVH